MRGAKYGIEGHPALGSIYLKPGFITNCMMFFASHVMSLVSLSTKIGITIHAQKNYMQKYT